MSWFNILDGVANAISGAYQKRQDVKKAKASGEAKIALAQQDGKTQVELTDAEWEAISVNKSDTTWKDEYITLVITAPIPLLLGSSIWAVYADDPTILNGVNKGVENIITLLPNYGELVLFVVLAGVGLKAWRNR